MSHFPKIPVRMLPGNEKLLTVQKSSDAGQRLGATNRVQTEGTVTAPMTPQYRTPVDRMNGNEMFRRYPSGQLDLDYAKDKIIEILVKVRNKTPITNIESVALSSCFPMTFPSSDPHVAAAICRTNLKITPAECMAIAALTASHLMKLYDFKMSSHAR